MKKEYLTPEMESIDLELTDTILVSIVPTESGNELPILTKKIVSDELNGDPDLDPRDQLELPTEY